MGSGRPCPPLVTVVIPAFNEAPFIARKIQDTLAQAYPVDRLEILVVDDGSTDGTADAALAAGGGRHVRVVTQPTRGGKSAGLNRGVEEAAGEYVVFSDANGSLSPGSLEAIVEAFDDPRVAVVSGRKMPVGTGAHGVGESMYWKFEAALKEAEGVFGAVVGADGGIYAVRRSAYRPIPPDVYGDDYWIPIDALSRGLLVRHAMGASATEAVSRSKRDDFERRARIAAGVWQGSLRHLRLARPANGWIAVAFVSHRLLRSIVVPLLLPVVLVTAWRAGRRGRGLMHYLATGQLVAWSAAGAGAVLDSRVLAVPYQFGMANVAAIFGGYRHLRRRQTGLWRRTERGDWQDARGLGPADSEGIRRTSA